MEPGPVLLETQGVSKSFGGVRAVDRCSIAVRRGTITGLIGPNGAGKSTLFNLISGVYRPDDGRILFDGEDITGLPPHRVFHRGIARTFQITRELASMTVLENLLLVPRGQRGERPWEPLLFPWRVRRQEGELVDRALAVLEWVGLLPVRHLPAGHLSGGQKKLLGLARAMMAGARLVLLDEPGAGVNPTLLRQIVETIQRMVEERGITVFLIEHDMDLVMRVCNPVLVMANGTLLMEGTPEEVRQDPRVLTAYLGGPVG